MFLSGFAILSHNPISHGARLNAGGWSAEQNFLKRGCWPGTGAPGASLPWQRRTPSTYLGSGYRRSCTAADPGCHCHFP